MKLWWMGSWSPACNKIGHHGHPKSVYIWLQYQKRELYKNSIFDCNPIWHSIPRGRHETRQQGQESASCVPGCDRECPTPRIRRKLTEICTIILTVRVNACVSCHKSHRSLVFAITSLKIRVKAWNLDEWAADHQHETRLVIMGIQNQYTFDYSIKNENCIKIHNIT